MKPFIMKVNESGKPIMTAEEIQKMVMDAYNEGYKDGRNQSSIITMPPSPPINVNPEPWYSPIRYADHTITTTPLNEPQKYGTTISCAGGTVSA